MECVQLRVLNIDFGQKHIIMRNEKGMKKLSIMLPEQLKFLSDRLDQIKIILEHKRRPAECDIFSSGKEGLRIILSF